MENTKQGGISSGLVAVAWSYISPLGTVRKLQDRQPCLNNPEEHHWAPLVRLSDAEAIIAQKDAEIIEQCRINGMGAERELALLGQIERQSAALRLARPLVKNATYSFIDSVKANEALAAIDALGE